MNEGTVTATFLVVFREGLEASLIVGIILTTLARLKQKKYFPHVFWGALLAVVVSIGLGFMLASLAESVQGGVEAIMEGAISLLACAVLTYMVFWMHKQARKLKSEIESNVEMAVTSGELAAILSLVFLSVAREGAETVLFLQAIALQASGAVSFWGAVSGLGLAVAICMAIFVGGRRIPLRPLFKWSGNLLLLMSAGLLAYGLHELEEAGIVPGIISPVWNVNHILNEKAGAGSFLKALFGYNGNPSLTEVISYIVYLAAVFALLAKGEREPQAAGNEAKS